MNDLLQAAHDNALRKQKNPFLLLFSKPNTSQNLNQLRLFAFILNKIALLPPHNIQSISQLHKLCLQQVISNERSDYTDPQFVTQLLYHIEQWHQRNPATWAHTRTVFTFIQSKVTAEKPLLLQVLSLHARLQPKKQSFLNYIQNLQLSQVQIQQCTAPPTPCVTKYEEDIHDILEQDTDAVWQIVADNAQHLQHYHKLVDILLQYEAVGIDKYLRRNAGSIQINDLYRGVYLRSQVFELILQYKSERIQQFLKIIVQERRRTSIF